MVPISQSRQGLELQTCDWVFKNTKKEKDSIVRLSTMIFFLFFFLRTGLLLDNVYRAQTKRANLLAGGCSSLTKVMDDCRGGEVA